MSHVVIEQIYSTLMRLDPDSNPIPELADSYEISDDGLVYTIKIKRGVKFHDGSPLTAADVKFTFDRLTDPATGYPYADGVKPIDHTDVIDDNTVAITLKAPTGPFLTALAFPGNSIVSKAAVESGIDLNAQPIGTGPFKFVSYQPGTSIVLAKNPDYFETGKPYIDALEMNIIPDDTARTNAILGGLVDFSSEVSPRDWETVTTSPGIVGLETSGGHWHSLIMNVSKPPFDNKLVRQAVAYAIGRQDVVDQIFFGRAEPSLGGVIPSWSFAHDPALETFSAQPNPKKAKALLTEAGFPDGIDVTLIAPSAWPILASQAPIYQAQLTEAGIRVTLEQMENPRWLQQVWTARDYEMSMNFWLSPLADPDDFMWMFPCGSGMGVMLYCNKKLDGLMDQARQTTDSTERAALYSEVQKLQLGDMPLVPTVNASILMAHTDKVHDYTPLRTGFFKSFKDVWLSQ